MGNDYRLVLEGPDGSTVDIAAQDPDVRLSSAVFRTLEKGVSEEAAAIVHGLVVESPAGPFEGDVARTRAIFASTARTPLGFDPVKDIVAEETWAVSETLLQGRTVVDLATAMELLSDPEAGPRGPPRPGSPGTTRWRSSTTAPSRSPR